jgi:hypothetical protein
MHHAALHLMHCTTFLLAHVCSFTLGHVEPKLEELMEEAQTEEFTNHKQEQGKP